MKTPTKKSCKVFFLILMVLPAFYLLTNPFKVIEREISVLIYKKPEDKLILKEKPPETIIKSAPKSIIISAKSKIRLVAVDSGSPFAAYFYEDNTYQEWQGIHQINLTRYTRI